MERRVKEIDLENAVGFLVGRVAHQLKMHVNKFLAESDINLSAEEASILTTLSNLSSAKNMGELSDILGRDATTLKRQLDNLAEMELIVREPSPQDRRRVVVVISDNGREMVDKTMPMTLALREQAMKNISNEDQKVLSQALSQMLKNLKNN